MISRFERGSPLGSALNEQVLYLFYRLATSIFHTTALKNYRFLCLNIKINYKSWLPNEASLKFVCKIFRNDSIPYTLLPSIFYKQSTSLPSTSKLSSGITVLKSQRQNNFLK